MNFFTIIVFVGLIVLPCTHSGFCVAKPLSFKTSGISDTLSLYLRDSYAGSLHYEILPDTSTGYVSVRHTLTIQSPDDRGKISEILLAEKRIYQSDGGLVSAFQHLKSQSGESTWSLSKDENQTWKLRLMVGGEESFREPDTIRDHIGNVVRLYTGIWAKTHRVGDSWHDTTFDLMSGRSVFVKTNCVEIPSDSNNQKYVFTTKSSIGVREERWELDTLGKTLLHEMTPFRAEAIRAGTSHKASADLVNAFLIRADRKASLSESICLSIDASEALDTSVSLFFEPVQSGCYRLKPQTRACTESQLAQSALPGAQHLNPTPTMQSEHEKIKSIALEIAKNESRICNIIKKMNAYVYRSIRKQNTATFSNALETLNAGYGDCGEHAVLLGALLRAAGVPARIVLGLVYIESKKSWGYHAWVMAYTGEWIFVDPAFGLFPAPDNRIPLVIDDSGDQAVVLAQYLNRIQVDYVKKR